MIPMLVAEEAAAFARIEVFLSMPIYTVGLP